MTDEALTCVTSRQLVRRLSRLAWVRAAVEAGFDSLAWVSGLLVTAATEGPAGAHMTRAVLGGVPGIVVVVTGCGLAAGLYRRRYLRGSRDEVRAVIVAGVLAAGGLMGICLAFGGGRRVLPAAAMSALFVVVLVLDMGQPVRIADMARRLAAGYGRETDIVFTGLRPGEKLHEDLLGPGERDLRPCHPLISQVPVPELSPAEVAGLDADAGPAVLRQVLARHACAPGPAGERDELAVPPQEDRKTGTRAVASARPAG